MWLGPPDLCPEGKFPQVQNIRSTQEGQIQPRYGLCVINDAPFGDPVHSVFRLNDTTPEASNDEVRVLGVAGDIRADAVGSGTFGVIDSGYSGNPLTAVVAAPYRTPAPWIYIGDLDRIRKVDSGLNVRSWGLPPPTEPPDAALTAPEVTYLESVGGGAWVDYGGVTAGTAVVLRINTLVTQLIYDTGADGMASVSLADMTGIVAGTTVEVGASPETVIVQSVLPTVAPTTIAAIIYDSGTTGFCTIQPTGSFSVGQIEKAIPADIERRYTDLNIPLPPRITITRTVDFPVDALVLLGGVEVVRILSVAIGPDDVQSFRCQTSGTFAAGAAIAGIASFRAWFNTTKAVGDPVGAQAVQNVTTPATTAAVAGGIQCPVSGGERNWGLVGAVASSPDDIIRLGIKVDSLFYVQAVRILLDVDPGGGGPQTFLQNYYQYEWDANDLITAIQSASPGATGLVTDAQATAVETHQAQNEYANQYGFTRSPSSPSQYTGQTAIPRTEAILTASSAIARQLALGNNQWIMLECRIGDLTRIGTDTTRTLQVINSAAIVLQFAGGTTPVTVEYQDAYLVGGYGPECGVTLPPYVYRYRYRSTETGERGNPSPSMQAGVAPRRGRVALSGQACSEAQCDVVDWFRFGGALARWEYVGTSPNDTPPVFNDDMADRQIESGEGLPYDLFQPWPVSDLPRSGTCNVAGNAIEWVSGDAFDPRWSPNSVIIVNGIATALYNSPSTTKARVIANCGSGSAVPFYLPSPTLLAQPMPAVWGGPINDVQFIFACGDLHDLGSIYWTHGNDPDSVSDANTIVVSSASEPLVMGCIFDGFCFVFSTEKLYRLQPTFGAANAFQPQETACTKGLAGGVHALCVTPYGIAFVGKDGVYLTGGGSQAVPITTPDMAVLFPQDGTVPESVRGLAPIDFCQSISLAWVDQLLYLDYYDLLGHARTLVYEPIYKRWTPDLYARGGAIVRLSEPGPATHTNIFGADDGNLYQVDANLICDGGDTDIDWFLYTPWANGDDPRATKQYGDAVVDFHPGGSVNGLTITPVVDNGNTALAPTTAVGQSGLLRATFTIEVNAGEGALSRNFGLQIVGALTPEDTQRPLLYLWEPAWLQKGTIVVRRATDWEDLGYKGAKFVQGVVIRANTYGVAKELLVEADGATQFPLTLNHNGELQKAYPLDSAGWTPFIAELVRLLGNDDVDWTLLDWRFVWEPAPEAATQWETQYTTYGYPGFHGIHDGIVAYQATAPVTWTIEYQDGDTGVYVLPATANAYLRMRQIAQAQKGKASRARWVSDEPFRLFKNDCSVRVQGWGAPGGYQSMNPFGGPSYQDGAGI